MGFTGAAAAEGASKGAEAAGAGGAAKGAEAAGAGLAGDAAGIGGAGLAGDAAGLAGAGAGAGLAGDAAGLAGAGLAGDAAGAAGAGGLSALDAVAAGLTPSGGLTALGTVPEVGAAALGGAAGAIPGTTTTVAGGGAGTAPAIAPAGVSSVIDPTSVAGLVGDSPAGGAAGAAGGAAGGAAAPAAGAAGSSGLSLSNLTGGVMSQLTKNPLGIALAAGGLGYNILQGQKQSEAVKAMQAQAGQQSATSAELQSYLRTGKLPPGQQTALDLATQAAKAKAIANAVASGQSGDPKQNSALASTLQSIDQQAIATASQIAERLFQAGTQSAGLSSNLYGQLAQIDQTQTATMGKAISNFAAALSGTPAGLTIKTG